MSKSKSKTFQKGEDAVKITQWIRQQVETSLCDNGNFVYDKLEAKYLITITKIEEKKKEEPVAD